MRITKFLTAVILAYGITYLQWGTSQLLGYYFAAFRKDSQSIIAANFIIGVSLTVISVNLFRTKEWARKAWLKMEMALALLQVLLLIGFYVEGYRSKDQLVSVLLVVLLGRVSRVHLTKPQVINSFS